MKISSFANAALLLVAFIWGTTYVIVKNTVCLIEPFTFNFLRFPLAAISLFFWICLYKRPLLRKVSLQLLIKGMALGFFLFAAYALLTFGLITISSSKAGFIIGLSVVFVSFFSIFSGHEIKPCIIAGERLGMESIAGCVFIFMGIIVNDLPGYKKKIMQSP